MISLPDTSGTNIDTNFDTAKIDWAKSSFLKPIQEIKAGIDCYGLCFGEQPMKPLMNY
jgi:hypothetical protein